MDRAAMSRADRDRFSLNVPLDPARAGITALPNELSLFAAPIHSNRTSTAACACLLRRAGTHQAHHAG